MGQLEPPSSRFRSRAPFFFIGRDSRGNWVVQHERRLCGGLFVDGAKRSGSRCSKMGINPTPSLWFLVFLSST